jgi:4-alpha-glucanotransferase
MTAARPSTEQLVPASYVDAYRKARTISPEVRTAVLAAMGLGPGAEPDDAGRVVIARPGERLPEPGEVVLEDRTRLGRVEALPPDTPYGYHRLTRDGGSEALVISGPGRCHLPPGLREWGWAVQLATTRSRRSWGIGDLGDLRELSGWSRRVGAGFVTVSPLGAPNPTADPEPSPYFASTRRFGSPLALRAEELPGATELDELAEAGRGLNAARLVDRRRAIALKMRALERTWAHGAFDRAAFEAWRAAQGRSLERWALFCVLAERHGPGWQSWPSALHDPNGPAATQVATEAPHRIAFHAWVQWCFDLQLAAASTDVRRIADMPVGVDPGGFDAWEWQGQIALGASVGAPPDRFNPAGQDWSIPPFIPHRLREAGYRPFIETVRAQLRHAGGLRIDHVLGLFRLWWIPRGMPGGAYVRYPTDDLLEIVALESHQAGAIVIGEDLGTVPSGVRRELRRRRVLSTRLALFERHPPDRYPRAALAGVTTHDLPTIAGVVTGADLDDQAASGVRPDPDGLALLRARLLAAAAVDVGADLDEVVVGLHSVLAASPPVLVTATLEDALRVERRPNMPGTLAAHRPNWSIPLPVPVEDLGGDVRVRSLVAALRR